MKKTRFFVMLLLLSVLCGALSSCFFFGTPTPWEEGLLRNTFFTTEFLAEHGVEDFPAPKLEGSYFDAEKNILYLNLTREEFDAYTDDIVDYLRQKKELKVKGFKSGSDLFGVFLLLTRYPLLASLDVEEIPYITENERLFGFSTEELGELYDGRREVEDPHFVCLTWEPTSKESGATYTTVMEFPHFYDAKYEVCYHGHEFESATYPVPGTVFTTTIMTCNRCHEEEREGYGYGDDLKEFSWTVTEGTELLASGMHSLAYRGELVEIPVKVIENATVRVTANDTELPLVKTIDGTWIYAFVMPYGDVTITVERVGEEP